MKFISLFSGIGGIDLGLEWAGMQCIRQVEIDPFCLAVLEKHWPNVPKYNDVTTFNATGYLGNIDAVAGGFPCQDISVAGKGKGLQGERSGLWREFNRIIGECGPRWVLIENVPALRSRGADVVLSDLEKLGYSAWPCVVGAWAVGAPHKRDRVWIVASRMGDAAGGAISRMSECEMGAGEEADFERQANNYELVGSSQDICAALADPECFGRERRQWGEIGCERHGEDARRIKGDNNAATSRHHIFRFPSRPGEDQHEWESPRLIKFPMGGAVDGVPVKLLRFANRNSLKAFGNAVVPQIPYLIGRWIIKADAAIRQSSGAAA